MNSALLPDDLSGAVAFCRITSDRTNGTNMTDKRNRLKVGHRTMPIAESAGLEALPYVILLREDATVRDKSADEATLKAIGALW